MSWDKFYLFKAVVTFLVPYTLKALGQKISAIIHKRTYKSVPALSCKNVVVIGGSFAGIEIVKKLVHSLPTGYRCILIEKNSHLNYLFAFPRNSVIGSYEKFAFIPYGGIAKDAPKGIFEYVQGEAVGITTDHISLTNGDSIPYSYLVIATGTSSLPPSKVSSTEREMGIAELKAMQSKVSKAKKIAVVGGGAVGVQLSSDIKSFFPEKDVALIHSRGQLMPTFGKRLHDYALKVLTEDLGVAVLLGERPEIPQEGGSLKLLNGKVDEFDLIVPCTGQRPNSSIISTLSPPSVSDTTSRILVKPTLQVIDPKYPNIYVLGDVAESGGPKMARAAFTQSQVVADNILQFIHGQGDLKTYKPYFPLEGCIKLSLGKSKFVMFMPPEKEGGREILVPMDNNPIDIGVKKNWRFYGADVRTVEKEELNLPTAEVIA